MSYVSVFATFPSDRQCGYDSALLALALMGDENQLDGTQHYDYTKFVLGVSGKSLDIVAASVGDNCSYSQSFSRCVGLFFVGYHSHQYNLAVDDILKKHAHLVDDV